MRVASPFNDYSKDSLNLYRVIDPEVWTKLVGRVQPEYAVWRDYLRKNGGALDI